MGEHRNAAKPYPSALDSSYGDVDSPWSGLSGISMKEQSEGASGSLLWSIGDDGMILCKDFGSVLSMHRDARSEVLAALRDIYDGNWTRHLGTDGAKTLSWSGKCGIIGGYAQHIDRQHTVMGAMGERFLPYRMPSNESPEAQAERALAHAGQEHEARPRRRDPVAWRWANQRSRRNTCPR